MNNLILDNEVKYLDESENLNITAKGISKIYILNSKCSRNINIILEDGSQLDIYDFNLNNKEVTIEVTQNNNSKFNYYHTFRTIGEYNLNYKAIVNGDNNYNNISVYGVSLASNKINLDGVVNEKSKGNILNENVKILNLGGSALVSPMLHVDALDVIANHNTAISNVRKEELFYLNSKGISKDIAIKLISDGYLYSLFRIEEEFYNKIKNI